MHLLEARELLLQYRQHAREKINILKASSDTERKPYFQKLQIL